MISSSGKFIWIPIPEQEYIIMPDTSIKVVCWLLAASLILTGLTLFSPLAEYMGVSYLMNIVVGLLFVLGLLLLYLTRKKKIQDKLRLFCCSAVLLQQVCRYSLSCITWSMLFWYLPEARVPETSLSSSSWQLLSVRLVC